jgi:hypothetical protein
MTDILSKGVIGITVAICGNVLISLALNCQKLAHRRLDREKALKAREQELATRRNSAALNEHAEEGGSQTVTTRTTQPNSNASVRVVETAPLLQHSQNDLPPRAYGTGSSSSSSSRESINSLSKRPLTQPVQPSKRTLISRLIPFPLRTTHSSSPLSGVREDAEQSGESHSTHALLSVESICDSPLGNRAAGQQNGKRGKGKEELMIEHGNESDYLKSKLWYVQIF